MLDKEDIEVKTIKKLFTFFDNYMKEEIKYMDSLNGVVRIDVADAPSYWFIMNSVDQRNPLHSVYFCYIYIFGIILR